jgi:AAA15 family ATPase/GTPase
MIKSIIIRNFKLFDSFTLNLNGDLNIIVGNNDAGKSTVLEAITLALTKRIGGKPLEYELSPFLFNKTCADAYVADVKAGKNPLPPEMFIELYLSDIDEFALLRGTNNSEQFDTVGIRLEVVFDTAYAEEYERFVEDRSSVSVIPTEYYKVNWLSFANGTITQRSLPLNAFHIDATTIRLQSGTDYYIQNIISDGMTPKEKVALAIAYRKLREHFSAEPSIQGINKNLMKGAITEKDLTIAIDISQKAHWDTNLIPYLDELPFHLIGKGEQTALKIMLALDRKGTDSDIILIEEPENHLSFASMSKLIAKIATKCEGKQIIIATHSAYVLNKLGIEKVFLLHDNSVSSLASLPTDTQNYFKKLSGYDTLRLILADKAILVEGPSDELIVQRAYRDTHGKLPLEDGIDVINVRGLSFRRFLDIAKELRKEVVVITDNDGDYQHNVTERYASYATISTITIFADRDETATTLEPQLTKYNELALLNRVFGTHYADKAALTDFMEKHKTTCALKIFESEEAVIFPQHIKDAVQ